MKAEFFARVRRLRHLSFERPAFARRRLALRAPVAHRDMKKAGFPSGKPARVTAVAQAAGAARRFQKL